MCYDGAMLSADNLRGLNINRAIQDGLRFFWASQTNRAANFPAAVTTTWPGSYLTVTAALTALAFENHGYGLPNNDSVPTGIYEKYIVRRAINYGLESPPGVDHRDHAERRRSVCRGRWSRTVRQPFLQRHG